MPLGMTIFFGSSNFLLRTNEKGKEGGWGEDVEGEKPPDILKMHWGGTDVELMSRFLYTLNYLTLRKIFLIMSGNLNPIYVSPQYKPQLEMRTPILLRFYT